MASMFWMVCRIEALFTCLYWILQNSGVHGAAVAANCTGGTYCRNGGSCLKSKNSEGGASCQCTPNWTGPLCQYQLGSPCSSQPCKNGGTCHNLGDGNVVCSCDVYWTGTFCQEFKGLPDSPPISTSCSSSDYQCSDGTCVVGQSLCDGITDCLDGSDEKLCTSIKPNSQCALWESECDDGTCIPRYKWCDLFRDCQKGEDELHCIPPFHNVPQTPARPATPQSGGLHYTNILVISSTMVVAVLAVSIFIYIIRRVRSSQRRLYSPVSWTFNRYGDNINMPYNVSQHANFCHHLPPHRCPRTNGLVGYPLVDEQQGATTDEPDVLVATLEMGGVPVSEPPSRRKVENEEPSDIPPAYSDVVKQDNTERGGDETPPPSYDDL